MTERYIDRPWIRKPDQNFDAPAHPDPEGLYSNENIDKSLVAMRGKSYEMGLKRGVAFLAFWPYTSPFPRVAFAVDSEIQRDPNPDKEGDIGTNYFGIAMSKLAYMLATHTNSGSEVRPVKTGEVAYKGGLIVITEEGSEIFAGYSGGTEEQDVQIALMGISTLIELSEASPR